MADDGQLTLAFFGWGPSSSTQCSLVPEQIRLASETCTERFLIRPDYEGEKQSRGLPSTNKLDFNTFPTMTHSHCYTQIFRGFGPKRMESILHLITWVNIPSFPADQELTTKVYLITEAEHQCDNIQYVQHRSTQLFSRHSELWSSVIMWHGQSSELEIMTQKDLLFWFISTYYSCESWLVGKPSYFSPTASCPTGSRRLWLLESRRRVKPSGSQREPCFRFRLAMITPSSRINRIMTTATASR